MLKGNCSTKGRGKWMCTCVRTDDERSGTRLFSEAITKEAKRID